MGVGPFSVSWAPYKACFIYLISSKTIWFLVIRNFFKSNPPNPFNNDNNNGGAVILTEYKGQVFLGSVLVMFCFGCIL